jgi:hypothetical protein
MRIDRRTMLSAAVLLAGSAAFVPASWTAATAAVRSSVPPFCVATGGARGFPLPQICRFFDYQQCLQAAADLHGNCVVNIDYRGELSMPPASAGARQRR